MFKSYLAVVKAKPDTGCLLGGVTRHESSRFASLAQAVAWLRVVMNTNRDAGRHPLGFVRGSDLNPEVS